MKIQIPTNCPTCDSTLQLVNQQLFCKNSACEAQLNKKLEHMCKTLGIKGVGPKTIEKLDLNDITELFYLDPDFLVGQLGSKIALKLLDEIERSKTSDLGTVLASMSIPLVGATASAKITSVVSHVDEITHETCKIAGLGEKVTHNLMEWITYELPDLKEFLPFSFKSTKKVIKNVDGATVCITGKLSSFKTKAQAYKQLEDAGFQIVESVTKTTKFLVDEEGKDSTKRKQADKLGITIIPNLIEFLNSKENIND